MSRVGGKPVEITQGVTVTVAGQVVKVKGKKGELSLSLPRPVTAEVKENEIHLTPANEEKQTLSSWGMAASTLRNMIEGVTEGFKVELGIEGVGYRAQSQGKTLKLSLGFSHDVIFDIPEGIQIQTPKPTEVIVTGIDKQKVGQVAAKIRGYKKPEPYKGKGIHYVGEYIRRKEGKKK